MNTEELVKLGNIVCKSTRRMLGEGFTPANLQNAMFDPGETGRGALKLALVRRGSVQVQDVPEMLAKISQVAVRVKAFKQGCCGELAMFAYNSVRTATDAQIIFAPSTKSETDSHAFVLMGVAEKFKEETTLAAIAQAHPGAVVIDYWAVENGAGDQECIGVFRIDEYEGQTTSALSSYDLDNCRTMSHT